MNESVHEVTVKLLIQRQKGERPADQVPWGDVLEDGPLGILGGRVVETRKLEMKTCASETCDQTFVYQEGGAATDSRRKDAIYCSPRCARAQAQREYRRRQK